MLTRVGSLYRERYYSHVHVADLFEQDGRGLIRGTYVRGWGPNFEIRNAGVLILIGNGILTEAARH